MQTVDAESSTGSEERCLENVPGPAVRVATANGNETATRDSSNETAGRSQSPHSSDEAVQQNAVEPKGVGR